MVHELTAHAKKFMPPWAGPVAGKPSLVAEKPGKRQGADEMAEKPGKRQGAEEIAQMIKKYGEF